MSSFLPKAGSQVVDVVDVVVAALQPLYKTVPDGEVGGLRVLAGARPRGLPVSTRLRGHRVRNVPLALPPLCPRWRPQGPLPRRPIRIYCGGI